VQIFRFSVVISPGETLLKNKIFYQQLHLVNLKNRERERDTFGIGANNCNHGIKVSTHIPTFSRNTDLIQFDIFSYVSWTFVNIVEAKKKSQEVKRAVFCYKIIKKTTIFNCYPIRLKKYMSLQMFFLIFCENNKCLLIFIEIILCARTISTNIHNRFRGSKPCFLHRTEI
jgi:hypothetical protein